MDEILETALDPISSGTFLGLEWGHMDDFYSLLIRLVINFVMVGIIARFFYYPKSKRRDYLFIFIIIKMNWLIFFFLIFIIIIVIIESIA